MPAQSAHPHPKLPSFTPDKFRVNHLATHTVHINRHPHPHTQGYKVTYDRVVSLGQTGETTARRIMIDRLGNSYKL